MPMRHHNVIQLLINASDRRNYLQIGGLNRGVFNSISADLKVGVDKTLLSSAKTDSQGVVLHESSSDDYFEERTSEDIKFDVIYLDGTKEYHQAYTDVINSLNCLTRNGTIVIFGCRPKTAFMATPLQQYVKINQATKLKNGIAYVGDLWKSIVRLRSTHTDLLVLTLDCEYGCGVVTYGAPESSLDLSLDEIERLVYSDLIDNSEAFLNLKPVSHILTLLVDKGVERVGRNKLYVENVNTYTENCCRDWFIKEPTKLQSLKNGIIFPATASGASGGIQGGVCDAKGSFIAGHKVNYFQPERDIEYTGTVPEDLHHVCETVVYAGYFNNHYGHTIVEFISRMWWYVENPDSGYKYVFISTSTVISSILVSLLILLGLSEEDVLLVKVPTRFDRVIVPEQSTYLRSGFKDKANLVYNTIRDRVKPGNIKKAYFTKSASQSDIVNEKYFEEYYQSLGYEVISPEKYSVEDQISLFAGLEHLVCPGGTLQHNLLFAKERVDVTIMWKVRTPYPTHFWINQFRQATSTYIDVSMNLLPGFHFQSVHLYIPTVHWRKYVYETTGEALKDEEELYLRRFTYDYIKTWAEQLIKRPQPWIGYYSKFTAFDFFTLFHKYVVGEDLDKRTKERLKEQLNHPAVSDQVAAAPINSEIAQLKTKLYNMENSTSWQATRCFRFISRKLRGIK